MVRLLAFASAPTWYQVSLYRELAERLGDDFQAVFLHAGQVDGLREDSWGEVNMVNDTGLLEGYPSTILFRRPGMTKKEAAALRPRGLGGLVRKLRPAGILLNNHGRSADYRSVMLAGRTVGSRLLLRSTPYDVRPSTLPWDLSRSVYLRAAYAVFDAFCAVGSLPRLHYVRYSGRPQDVYDSPYCLDEFFLRPRAEPGARSEARQRFREEHGIGSDERVFVSVTRLIPQKRVDLTLAAFAASLGRRPARLVIVGDGALHDEVRAWKERLGPQLVWIGAQNRWGVAAALAAADSMLLGSDYEPWGVVVNEGLMFHLPVVTSANVAAAVDLVQEGVTGYRFAAGDLNAYASAISQVHTLLDQGISPASFERLLNIFSAARAADGVLAALDGQGRAPLRLG